VLGFKKVSKHEALNEIEQFSFAYQMEILYGWQVKTLKTHPVMYKKTNS